MPDLLQIAPGLLEWWDAGHDNLPWRRSQDPYAIWVAEVMLQQTQVATVIPYYERWMARFPDVEALAAASLEEVLKLWEGLGYYGRARNLHAAAAAVSDDYGGQMPESVDELMNLKGIGRYTAGAIASIAFDRPAPVLDGNVIRVFSRLWDIEEDVTRAETKKRMWLMAGQMVDRERPGDFNQALMELGQKICLLALPLCHQCPLTGLCLSRKRGTQSERPVRPPRKKTPHYDLTAGIIMGKDDRLLIARRPIDGLLGGLWEFPGGNKAAGETLPEALRRNVNEDLGIDIEVGRLLGKVNHAYTHVRITVYAFHARHLAGLPEKLGVADHAWVRPEDLHNYAFGAKDHKIIGLMDGAGALSAEAIDRDRLAR
jgi:A/G-specific adenine glycosylase